MFTTTLHRQTLQNYYIFFKRYVRKSPSLLHLLSAGSVVDRMTEKVHLFSVRKDLHIICGLHLQIFSINSHWQEIRPFFFLPFFWVFFSSRSSHTLSGWFCLQYAVYRCLLGTGRGISDSRQQRRGAVRLCDGRLYHLHRKF